MTVVNYIGTDPDQVRSSLLRDFGFVRNLVAPAYGPAGGAVLHTHGHSVPRTLKAGAAIVAAADGVPGYGSGTRMLAEAMSDIDRDMGNGASTLALLADAFARAVHPVIAAGLPVDVALSSLVDFANATVCRLEDLAVAPDTALTEALILNAASGNQVLATHISEAYIEVGDSGELLVGQAEAPRDELDVAKGFHIEGGLADSRLVTTQQRYQEIDQPCLLILRGELLDISPIAQVLNHFVENKRNLVIVADAVRENALAALLANRANPNAVITAIRGPGQGAWRMPLLEDLAVFTGGRVIATETGGALERVSPQDLGQLGRIVISHGFALAQDGAGDATQIATRENYIRHEIAAQKHLAFDRQENRKRLARFGGGIAWIRIAKGHQFTEMRRSAEAAISARTMAEKSGILSTGAAALLHAAPDASLHLNMHETTLARRLKIALLQPLACLIGRAGADEIIDTLRRDALTGYDVMKGSVSQTAAAFPAGIMVRAVRDAASIVGVTLSTGALLQSVPQAHTSSQ